MANDDLFGEALYAYSKGDRAAFSFVMADGTAERFPLRRYFRTRFTPLEVRMIGLAHGEILDVGCATGYLVPALRERGTVTAIDVSPGALRVARENGIDAVQADIWAFERPAGFDTIVIFENNLGIGGTLEGAAALLLRLKAMLKPGGQILIEHWDLHNAPYAEAVITPRWKGRDGKPLRWVHISLGHLAMLCERCGLRMETLDRTGYYALVRLTAA